VRYLPVFWARSIGMAATAAPAITEVLRKLRRFMMFILVKST
jgi:hypothetical protein